MYVDPFWLGVLVTLIIEILAFIGYGLYLAIRRK